MPFERFRKALKKALPARAASALRAGRHAYLSHGATTFEGIYKNLEEVARAHPHRDFDDEIILAQREREAAEKWSAGQNWDRFPKAEPLSPIYNMMPLLLATILERKANARVLDFGGGLGGGFVDCCRSLPNADRIEFRVVEMRETQARAKKIFSPEPRISFSHTLPPGDEKFDLVYVGSALQYIPEYKSLMRELAERAGHYLFLTNHFLSDCPTFATAQKNMGGKVLSAWILNHQEILDIAAAQGFRLIYRSANYQPYHRMDNFSETHRVSDSTNLLFAKA